jgi:hypothetical protein
MKKGKNDASQNHRWVYSTNSFALDQIISNERMMSFYNYNYHSKLFGELEFFLKLSLYPNPDYILKTVSFNQPEYKILLNIQKLENHENINNFLNIQDPFVENEMDLEYADDGIFNKFIQQNTNSFDQKDNKVCYT